MCTPVSRIQPFSVERWTKVTHSVAGKLSCALIAEWIGAFVARQASREITDDVGLYFAPSITPLLTESTVMLGQTAAVALLALKVKDFRLRVMLGAGYSSLLFFTHLRFEENPQWAELQAKSMAQVLQYVLSLIGENFGGFVGLTVAAVGFNQRAVVYWDQSESCYAVSTARGQVVKELYNQIVNPQSFILKVPCAIGASLVRGISYHANLWIPFLGQMISSMQKGESAQKVLEPFVAQAVSKRFFHSTSLPFKRNEFYSFLFSIFHSTGAAILEKVEFHLLPAGEPSELIARLFLRSLKGYITLIENSSEILQTQTEWMESPLDTGKKDLFVAVLRKKIEQSPDKAQGTKRDFINRIVTDKTFRLFAAQMVAEALRLEEKLWGFNLLKRQDCSFLQECILIHLKYFFTYMSYHIRESIRSPLEPCEDLKLIGDLNHVVLSGYFALILPQFISCQMKQSFERFTNQVSAIQRKVVVWIYRREQSSQLLDVSRILLKESYVGQCESENRGLKEEIDRLRVQMKKNQDESAEVLRAMKDKQAQSSRPPKGKLDVREEYFK